VSDPAREVHRFADNMNARWRPLEEDDLKSRAVVPPPAAIFHQGARGSVLPPRSLLVAAVAIALVLGATALAAVRRGDDEVVSTMGGDTTTTAVIESTTAVCVRAAAGVCLPSDVVSGTTEAPPLPAEPEPESTTTTATPTPSSPPSSPPSTARPTPTTAPGSTTTSLPSSTTTVTTEPPGTIYGRACFHDHYTVDPRECTRTDGSASVHNYAELVPTDPLKPENNERVLASNGTFNVTLPAGRWGFPRLTMAYRCFWTEPASDFDTQVQTVELTSGETLNMDFVCTDSSGSF